MPPVELETLAATLGKFAFPRKFAVEICAECNLACSMCHHPSMKRAKGTMPFELWRKCADEIAAVSPRTECWFSFCGEPLLEPELLLRCLDYGRSVGLESLNINTNGMLLTPDLDDAVLGSGAHLIVFGVDGFSKASFEKYRVKADRDVVYRNVERLLARRDATGSKLAIQVQFITMEDNAHEVDAYKAHWLARNAVVKVRRQLSWGGQFETGLGISNDERIPCPWAVTMMHVFWDGRVPRCPGDTECEEGAGNAWDDSLANLWARLGRYRELHLERRFGELPERCHKCTDWMTGAAERVRPEAAVVPVEPTWQGLNAVEAR
ncbi:radical SAM/SPASM domain-containing protein [Ramlibacter sp.]|uniref:radical SAM/SPASM domain-containing protein n=1 Tax=Ramlibacter sp. TaxID=1917967 RepID=UPI002D265346|nr:radical SAM/SPASM domain-containing protein [Ramlibacter sp.]HYD76826.1 radical SAM/SPASM domain-containing protein [Ramlibacter sp.]